MDVADANPLVAELLLHDAPVLADAHLFMPRLLPWREFEISDVAIIFEYYAQHNRLRRAT